jgi:tetratricopeptide (TPR) repeat protein
MWEYLKWVLENIVKPLLSPRRMAELTLFLVLVIGSVYLALHWPPTLAVLAAAFWISPGLLYVWIVYLRRTRPVFARIFLTLAISTLFVWGFALWRSLTSSHYKIIRLINLSQELAKTDYGDAADKVKEAFSLARQSADRELQLKSVCPLGEYQAILGDLNGSKESLEYCFSLAVDLKDLGTKTRALVALAELEALRSDTSRAEQHLLQAHDSSNELPDSLLKATVMRALGDQEQNLAKYDDADKDYTIALNLFRTDRSNRRHTLLGLGILYDFLQGNKSDRHSEADVLLGRGALYDKLGRNDESRADYAKAGSIYHETRQRQGEANAVLGLA